MRVADVIAIKGASVVSVRADQPLSAAIAAMAQRKIGSVVVLDRRGQPQGIVSEPDVIAIVVARGAECLEQPVRLAVRAAPPRCAPQQTVTEALAYMTRERVRYLLVIHGDALQGVISIGDLVKARLESTELESKVLRDMARSQVLAAT